MMGDQLSRRRLIQLGAAAGLAAGGGTLASAGAAQAASAGSLPVSKAFDIDAPSSPVFMKQPAWCPTVMQSAGYDHLNRHWYVAQVMYNPGDGVPYATRKHDGDIAITKLSADGTTKIGRMYLRGFGHGAQFGVEPTAAGSAPYLWIEYASQPNSAGDGYGTKVCRIKYLGPPASQPPRSFHWDDPDDRADLGFKDRTPDPSALPGTGTTLTAPRPVVDVHHRRLMVRFNRGGTLQCAVWDLDTAVSVPLGAPLAWRDGLYKPEVSQGFCLYGSYMYMLEGTAYADGGPADTGDVGSTVITRIDLNTGAQAQFLTRALKSLTYREPEGMNVMLIPSGTSWLPRLTFGFASGDSGDRRVNIAYKDALVQL